MLSYVLRRIVVLIPTLLCISLLVFLMIYLVPGDPAQIMLGERANAETLAALRKEMGLDQPWYVQFARFFRGVLQGDFGRSIEYDLPVIDVIGEVFVFAMILNSFPAFKSDKVLFTKSFAEFLEFIIL